MKFILSHGTKFSNLCRKIEGKICLGKQKKVLSLVLCVAMMLSVMVVGAGAAFSDQSKIKNTEAVDACTALNIIGGYPDGSFKPEGNITRAEVTKMICVALNGGKEPNLATNATPTFSDVRTNANSAWAEKYIESCYAQGIVSGVGAGKFAPAGNVTGTQLAKMLLVALGYKSENEGFTGNAWATNVNTIASAKGLYEGLEKLDVSAALTRDSAARMIWNALQAYEVEYKTSLIAGPDGKLATQITVQDKVVGSTNDKITLLRDKYDAWLNVGTLVSVDNKTITITMSDADVAASDYVVLNSRGQIESYDVTFSKLDQDHSDLLGQKIKVIFKNGKTNDVIGVYATGDNTTYSTVLNAVENDNGKVKFDGKSYSVDSTGITTYIDGQLQVTTANSKTTTDLKSASYFEQKTSADEVKFIDTNDNGKIDTAFIKTVAVKKVTYASSTQIVAGGTTYKYADDNIAKDLAKDDWVVITKDLYNDCNNIVLVKKVEATIAGTRDKTGYKQYRVDGTWYNTADNKALDAKAGNKASVVTYNGIIFFADKLSNSSSSVDLALVVETGSFAQAKLAFFDGTTKTVTIDDDSNSYSAGDVMVYEVNGNEYKLTTLNADNLDNDDYTIQSTKTLQSAIVSGNGTTIATSATPKYVNKIEVADTAKVLLYSTNHKSKYITGKQFKSIVWNTSNSAVTGSNLISAQTAATAALTSKVDGLTKVSYLAVNVGTVQPDEFQTNDNYAVVVSDSYKYDSDYICYDIFNGKDTITVTEKKSSDNSRKTGDIVGYSKITDAKVIEDVTPYAASGAVANSTSAGQYAVGAIQGVNSKGDEITVDGTNTFKITNDTKIFFVDSDAENNKDDYKGVASDATKVDSTYEADEIADTDMYYYNCAYILDTSVSGNKADLSVLVIDVKNRMANKKETAQTVSSVAAGLTATVNGKAITVGTTQLAKGEVMVITGTSDGAKNLTLTHAKFADGSTTKTAVASGSFSFDVYADGTGNVEVAFS